MRDSVAIRDPAGDAIAAIERRPIDAAGPVAICWRAVPITISWIAVPIAAIAVSRIAVAIGRGRIAIARIQAIADQQRPRKPPPGGMPFGEPFD